MSVSLRHGESPEDLLKRWRKAVSSAGVLKAARKKRWFISKSQQRRIAKARAIRKARRKSSRSRSAGRSRGRR